MADRVTILELPTEDNALDAVEQMRAIFQHPGAYRVEPLLKAAGAAADPIDDWEAWFMRRLHEVTRDHFTGSRQAIWTVLDDLLQRQKVQVPSQLDYWQLQETLFDLTTASTARIVGLDIPKPLRRRLGRMGWTQREALDFPAIAYRFGKIYSALQATGEVTPWAELVDQAKSYPLTRVEEATIEGIRRRAGVNLRPILDQAGRVWTAEREIEPLREVLERHTRDRTGAREAARELANTNRAEGNFRDMDRVARTELAEISTNAAWDERSKTWDDNTLIFRQPTRNACRGCLRLFKAENGMPRLYTVAEVEAQDALGLNRGSWREWHLRKGPIHPNGLCPPFSRWLESLRPTFEAEAADWASKMKRLRVFAEAA